MTMLAFFLVVFLAGMAISRRLFSEELSTAIDVGLSLPLGTSCVVIVAILLAPLIGVRAAIWLGLGITTLLAILQAVTLVRDPRRSLAGLNVRGLLFLLLSCLMMATILLLHVASHDLGHSQYASFADFLKNGNWPLRWPTAPSSLDRPPHLFYVLVETALAMVTQSDAVAIHKVSFVITLSVGTSAIFAAFLAVTRAPTTAFLMTAAFLLADVGLGPNGTISSIRAQLSTAHASFYALLGLYLYTVHRYLLLPSAWRMAIIAAAASVLTLNDEAASGLLLGAFAVFTLGTALRRSVRQRSAQPFWAVCRHGAAGAVAFFIIGLPLGNLDQYIAFVHPGNGISSIVKNTTVLWQATHMLTYPGWFVPLTLTNLMSVPPLAAFVVIALPMLATAQPTVASRYCFFLAFSALFLLLICNNVVILFDTSALSANVSLAYVLAAAAGCLALALLIKELAGHIRGRAEINSANTVPDQGGNENLDLPSCL